MSAQLEPEQGPLAAVQTTGPAGGATEQEVPADSAADGTAVSEGTCEHVRRPDSVEPLPDKESSRGPGFDWEEPSYSTTNINAAAARWGTIELMLEAIRRATPLDAEERTPDDLLLVLAFRRAMNLVFLVDQTTAENHLHDLCRILHVEKLPDGTMLGKNAVGPVLAGP